MQSTKYTNTKYYKIQKIKNITKYKNTKYYKIQNAIHKINTHTLRNPKYKKYTK